MISLGRRLDPKSVSCKTLLMLRSVFALLLLAGASEVQAQVDSLERASDSDPHLVLGVTLGFPALLNAVAGVDAWHCTARISGAYYVPESNGVQLEVGPRLDRGGPTRLDVLAGLGTANIWWGFGEESSAYLSYTSLGFRVDWKGLFLTQGFFYRLHGTGDFEDGSRPGYFFSVGYAASIRL
jgi:hypothetical protein